jgi:cytochrome bd-type quinol oxidase subunit 1
MRVMQSRVGMGVVIFTGLLVNLLIIALIAVLVALAIFLIRRSRVAPMVVERTSPGPAAT